MSSSLAIHTDNLTKHYGEWVAVNALRRPRMRVATGWMGRWRQIRRWPEARFGEVSLCQAPSPFTRVEY